MALFDYGEFVLFLILFFGYVPVIYIFKSYPQAKLFYFGYTALLIGVAASNLESFEFPWVMNVLEHGVGVGLAGIIFLLYTYRNYRETIFLRKKLEEMER
ncbi:MAG: hypothetical protein AABX02_03530 [archaeon]